MTTRWPTARVAGYASLTVLGLVAALLLGRPEPALLAAPFALYLAVGLATATAPNLHAVRLELPQARALEGDLVDLHVHAPPGAEVRTLLPPGLDVEATEADTDTDTDTGHPGRLTLQLRPARWGAFRVGRAAVRTTDPMRLFTTEVPVHDRGLVLRVHPEPTALRRAVEAAQLQLRVGGHTSGGRGDGIEFADVRPFTPGDRARAVNWRASARRPGELWVNDRRPERSADVVLLLDTFGDEGADRAATLDRAVRSLAAVAATYHADRDRIGLLTFGGQLRWVTPGLGQRALLRVVDGLLDTEVLLTSTWAGVTRVPFGALPPRALLLAVTPLDDDTAVQTLLDLRARGFDVAAVVVPPPPELEATTDLGRRLVALQRDTRRRRLERLGVATATAATTDDLPLALQEVDRWRRRARRVRA